MEDYIERYINDKFKHYGLSRNGGWADGISCKDLEDIINDAINYGKQIKDFQGFRGKPWRKSSIQKLK